MTFDEYDEEDHFEDDEWEDDEPGMGQDELDRIDNPRQL
jgi:hypothetical protein